LCSGDIDPGQRQSLEVFVTSVRINDMEGLLTTLETLSDERKQYAIFFVMAVKERTDMTSRAEH
jgi:hypothetical protein